MRREAAARRWASWKSQRKSAAPRRAERFSRIGGRTGEILVPDAPGRDPIVTRILWLRGREAQNANAYGRYIYIHGTPEERNIGTPASYGCIRMRSRDVIQLYDIVGCGREGHDRERTARSDGAGRWRRRLPAPTRCGSNCSDGALIAVSRTATERRPYQITATCRDASARTCAKAIRCPHRP